MLLHRPADQRGHTRIDWLDSRHSFSFSDYHDPAWMGFRTLRVINDDLIASGAGFGMHPHRDMEIISWIVDGALAHQDSAGNAETIRPGDAQRMTAGTGIWHSEHNVHDTTTRLIQIWLQPSQRGLKPGYAQKTFPLAERQGRLRLIAATDGRGGAISLNSDADVYAGTLAPGDHPELAVAAHRHLWIQVISGSATVAGSSLRAGDGLAASDLARLEIQATAPTDLLVFDLP